MYLFVNLNFSPKKILAIISDFITNKLNLKKLSYSKNGPLTCYLKGYKLILTGRFENTKTSMSKTLILKKGSLNSTSLNNRVDFFTKNLNTKFGLCNFKI
jgi:NAD-dependent DNA ligase